MASHGPITFREVLPMPSHGPITFLGGADDALAWAHKYSKRCCRCPWIGPFCLQRQLPIALFGPVKFFCEVLPMPLRRPIALTAAVSHQLCLGPLTFRQVLLMPSYWPIAFAAVDADGLTWAHYYSGRC